MAPPMKVRVTVVEPQELGLGDLSDAPISIPSFVTNDTAQRRPFSFHGRWSVSYRFGSDTELAARSFAAHPTAGTRTVYKIIDMSFDPEATSVKCAHLTLAPAGPPGRLRQIISTGSCGIVNASQGDKQPVGLDLYSSGRRWAALRSVERVADPLILLDLRHDRNEVILGYEGSLYTDPRSYSSPAPESNEAETSLVGYYATDGVWCVVDPLDISCGSTIPPTRLLDHQLTAQGQSGTLPPTPWIAGGSGDLQHQSGAPEQSASSDQEVPWIGVDRYDAFDANTLTLLSPYFANESDSQL